MTRGDKNGFAGRKLPGLCPVFVSARGENGCRQIMNLRLHPCASQGKIFSDRGKATGGALPGEGAGSIHARALKTGRCLQSLLNEVPTFLDRFGPGRLLKQV